MKIIRSKEVLALAISVCMLCGLITTNSNAQLPSGKIGFSLNVQADGIFNPKVVRAVVNAVENGSQAQNAGLAIGDELIKVQDIDVPGKEASILKPHMEFVSGKPKKLVFRKANGQIYEATLVKP